MTDIRTENVDGLLIATMSRGKANALNVAMVGELNAALAQARDASIRGLVIASDRPKFFSAGFDAKEVFAYDRAAMTTFFGAFMDLYEGLFRLPKPVVAALAGHTVAGGAILALVSDVRVMADGPYQFALNEVNLGIILPPGLVRIAVDVMGMRQARELFLGGEPMTPARALETGLVSELAAPEKVLERAIVRARALADKPAVAFGAIKQSFIDAGGHGPAGSDRQDLGRFIDHWFLPDSVQRRQALIESLR
jgi:enoyl-CoA hydratase/carnithine racemase